MRQDKDSVLSAPTRPIQNQHVSELSVKSGTAAVGTLGCCVAEAPPHPTDVARDGLPHVGKVMGEAIVQTTSLFFFHEAVDTSSVC